MSIILTAYQGKNDLLFKNVADLYLSDGMKIADVTYGNGNFWKGIETERFDFYSTDIATGVDCRHLPYLNESMDVIVFDPPYIYNPKATVKSSISGSYNVNETEGLKTNQDVLDFYKAGMQEANRVLLLGGLMMVKCQDVIQSSKQHWNHIIIYQYAMELGLYGKDMFVLVQQSQPTIRWPIQKHARKNHSYLWIFKKVE